MFDIVMTDDENSYPSRRLRNIPKKNYSEQAPEIILTPRNDRKKTLILMDDSDELSDMVIEPTSSQPQQQQQVSE